jgi:hypothetical protein
MADTESKMEDFNRAFLKLKGNREKVPLEQLTTRYAKAYNQLVEEVSALGEWFISEYIAQLTGAFPLHPEDTAGNEWLREQQQAIIQDERKEGGIFAQARAALIDQLNIDAFFNLSYQLYHRIEQEAFDPYWQRHCRWVGEPDNRWIYNDVTGHFWYPPGKSDQWPQGVWIDNQYNAYTTNYPPNIKENDT